MTGSELIHAERDRQILEEGWGATHDDEHDDGQLILAAVGYALEAVPQFSPVDCYAGVITRVEDDDTPPDWWPWDEEWWKPSDDPVRNLTKAGALIAAEIDRLVRARKIPERMP